MEVTLFLCVLADGLDLILTFRTAEPVEIHNGVHVFRCASGVVEGGWDLFKRSTWNSCFQILREGVEC